MATVEQVRVFAAGVSARIHRRFMPLGFPKAITFIKGEAKKTMIGLGGVVLRG